MKRDLSNQKINNWYVIGPSLDQKNNNSHTQKWDCRCRCGIVKSIHDCSLLNGRSKGCGKCNGVYKYIGKKYGELTVLGKSNIIKPHYIYLICKCSCGKNTIVQSKRLITGKTKSCGHLKNSVHYKKIGKKVGELMFCFFNLYNIGAKQRNIEFNISMEYAWDLFQKQNGKCALSGQKIYLPKKYNDKATASLDRIDSKKGYIEGNVQWAHKDINRMKQYFTDEYFINICKMVTDFKYSLKCSV